MFSTDDVGPSMPNIVYRHPPRSSFPVSSHFSTALSDIISAFEAHENDKSHSIHRVVCFSTSNAVCLYDKYPKAQKHLLLVPRLRSPLGEVKSLSDLIPSVHFGHMRSFHSLANAVGAKMSGTTSHRILCGYHAVPSLVPLHLHIISSDFDSDCMKTKKHINSFTNLHFFVSPEALESHMESSFVDGMGVRVHSERAEGILKTTPFTCRKCGQISKNVPRWKDHNRTCTFKWTENNEREREMTSILLGWQRKDCGKEAGDGLNQRKRKNENEEQGRGIRKFLNRPPLSIEHEAH